jgi:hypothetical protein
MKLIRPGIRVVLHHTIFSCINYEEWNVNELFPMFSDEHLKFHGSEKKGKGKYGVCADDPAYKQIRNRLFQESLSIEEKERRKQIKNKCNKERYASLTLEQRSDLSRHQHESKSLEQIARANKLASIRWFSMTQDRRNKRNERRRMNYAKKIRGAAI